MSFLQVLYNPKFATVILTHREGSASSSTSITFVSAQLGQERLDRRLVVGVSTVSTSSGVSSITLAGESLSLHHDTSIGQRQSGVWSRMHPSGTTADIVVNRSGPGSVCAIGVWSVYGAASTGPSDTAGYAVTPSSKATVNIDLPAGGVLVATHNAVGLSTWSGATEDFDDIIFPPNRNNGASGSFAQAQTSAVISAEDGGSTDKTMVAASFRPA